MLLLSNAIILAAGGNNSGDLSSAELYNPQVGTWTATGSLSTARSLFSMVQLANGNVLAAGGDSITVLASAEVYNPLAGTWTATGPLAMARFSFQMVLLPNGNVLAAGGTGSTIANQGSTSMSAELYNPSSGIWTTTGSLAKGRTNFQMVVLSSGSVLAAGGQATPAILASAEIYSPTSGTWAATGDLNTAREDFRMVVLSNGNVLAAGGTTILPTGGVATVSSAEIYNPNTGTWTVTGSMNTARSDFEMVLLPNGNVLVADGEAANGATASAEVYNPTSGTWTSTGPLATGRVGFQMVLF